MRVIMSCSGAIRIDSTPGCCPAINAVSIIDAIEVVFMLAD